jgi:CheY-like chemotaxis protein
MADDKLQDILNELRLRTDPALLAFLPDEENQNLMLRNLPAAVLIRNSDDSIILEANDYTLKLFGVERKLLIGSTLSDLGLSIHFHDPPSSSQVSGDPRNARVIDSQGVEIPAIVFDRKIDISGKHADLFIIVDGTLLGASPEASPVPRYSILKSYLNVLSQGYIMVEITGTSTEQDLIILETSENLPASISQPVQTGESISKVLPQGEAARLVEEAIEASRTGRIRAFESKASGRIDVFPGEASLVLLCFGSEKEETEEEKDHIITTESSLSSSVVKTVLLLAPENLSRESGSEMLRMLGFVVVDATSPGQALEQINSEPDRFLFVLADLESVQPETIELMKVLASANKHLILAGSDLIKDSKDIPHGKKVVYLLKPYGINDLASAISEICN